MGAYEALNRLAKWRSVFAGWQLGTRPKGDPECDAVRDHREATLLLRAEVTTLAALLIKKGVFSQSEFEDQLEIEADLLSSTLEARFPGFKAEPHGMSMDVQKAAKTMQGWKP